MWPEEALVTRVTVIAGERRRHPRFHVHRPLPTHPTPLVHKLSSRFCILNVYVMSQLLLLGKFEYGGGPIFKVVLEC